MHGPEREILVSYLERSMPFTQEEFDRKSKEIFNKRVGDFLYVHYEADPSWHRFWDIQGNGVTHGGRGYSTDVRVKILKKDRPTLEPRLRAYLQSLLGRHKLTLHEEGYKLYENVISIHLPYTAISGEDLDVTIHTGCGGHYDQDEIAYEVMAALSDLPVLKALAPADSYYEFIRKDSVTDTDFVRFEHESLQIAVTFGYSRELQPIVVTLQSTDPVLAARFKEVMFDEFAEWVKAKAETTFNRTFGVTQYVNKETKVVTEIIASEGEVTLFSISSPYSDWYSFNRLKCAKSIMEALYTNLIRYPEEVATVS